MDKEIYAQNGVKENDLNTEYTAIFKDKKNNTEIEFKYNAQYDPRLIIDMPFIGEGENANIEFLWQMFNDSPQYLSKYNKMNMNSNNIDGLMNHDQHWFRSGTYYFMHLMEKYPDAFSTDSENGNKNNTWRIQNDLAPIIDKQFVKYFKLYEEYLDKNIILVHHHIGEDGQAVALPSPIHPGHGGIHSVEEDIGVTYNAENHSKKIQEALDANYIQSGNDVWSELENGTELRTIAKNKFEYIQELRSESELLSNFPSW